MSEAQKTKVTIIEVSGKPWNKPNSQQFWHTVVTDETPSEPTKFIQDKSKGAPEPKVGETYEGNMYEGNKFYAFGDKAPAKSGGDKPVWKDNSKEITLGMVWKTVAGIRGLPEDPEDFAKFFEIVKDHTDELLRMSENMEKTDE